MRAYIEYDGADKVCRIIRVSDPARPVLEALASGHSYREYDVDWSKRDECYYGHESGGGHGRVYLHQICGGMRKAWAKPFVTFAHASSDGPMLSMASIRELGYDLEVDEKIPTVGYIEWGVRTYYCERCADFLPENEPCECVYWCDECCEWLNKKSGRCEHYCAECDGQAGYNYCDTCEEAGR